jgi:hypothetical protein
LDDRRAKSEFACSFDLRNHSYNGIELEQAISSLQLCLLVAIRE